MSLNIVSLHEKSDKPNSGEKEKKGWQPPFMEDQAHLTLGEKKEKKKNESSKHYGGEKEKKKQTNKEKKQTCNKKIKREKKLQCQVRRKKLLM